MFHID